MRSAVLAVLAVALSSGVAAAQTEANYLAFALSYDLPEPPQSVPALPENYLAFEISYDLVEPEQAMSLENYLAFDLSYDLTGPAESITLENYLAFDLSYELAEPAQSITLENYLAFDLSHDLAEPVESIALENYLAFDVSREFADLVLPMMIAEPELTVAYEVSVRAHQQQRKLTLSLYAAQGALQVLDVVTTSKALGAGHREANPLFKSGNISTMVIAKAAVMGANFYMIERLSKKHPKRAKWVMVGTNALMAFVVLNNAAVLMN